MTIAINTRFLLKDYLEGYGYFLREILQRITRDHPEHKFIFIFDRPYDPQFIFSDNITPVVAGPAARHPLLWKWWYDVKIPAILKKHKADVFVSADGFCLLRTEVPQCLVIHDLAFLHFPRQIPKSWLLYYKRYTPRFLKKASIIATVSEFSRKDILAHYKVDESKLKIVYNAAKQNFRRLSADERSETKAKYASGKEYFLYAGSIHPRKNLLNVLKAFSVFKKKLKSNMKLVLAGRLAWRYNSFEESLKTYKYRDEVVMTGYLPEEELVKVMGAAYGLLYVSMWEGFGMPVLEAMRAEIPVITSSASAMQEVAGDAALTVNPQDYNELADKMILLYKDENLRSSLIQKGKMREQQFSWDQSAAHLWDCICEAVG
jgi:glycosyltransferase involved in cell wall biosynthesis